MEGTFPFPEGLWQTGNLTVAEIEERYHEHRRSLMRQLWLGLTNIYNLFHTREPHICQGSQRQQEIGR